MPRKIMAKPLTPDLYKKTGVYRIRCLVNGRVYIGGAYKGFKERWNTHKEELRNGRHSPAQERRTDKGYIGS